MRWPDREIVDDESQGVRLETMQELARYWATDYDWRQVEARLQALPQFITEIDGVDIHFIHVRSKHDGRVADHRHARVARVDHRAAQDHRPAHRPGGTRRRRAADAFDVVIPSLPGHGFSGTPTTTGWDPIRIARAWTVLMERLGYERYVAQGGDWGNAVTEQMALQRADGIARHPHEHGATIPDDIAKALQFGDPPPRDLSEEERYAWDQLDSFYKHGLGYAKEMANRPQTLYALEDSPVGLAAWMLDHDARSLSLIARVFDGQAEGLTKDDILDNATLYWLTRTADLVGSPVLGEQARRSSRRRVSTCRSGSASSPTRSTRPRAAGRRAPIPS